jgi:hypothetical protein
MEEGERLGEFRSLIAGAHKLVFLGFAYHPQNIALLRNASDEQTETRRVIGTAYGMPESDREVVVSDLQSFVRVPEYGEAKLIDMTCVDFFNNYRRALMT